MTVYCGILLPALAEMDLVGPPIALIPRDLHPSAEPLRDELGDRVRWVGPANRHDETTTLTGELRWVHREVPAMLERMTPRPDVLILPYHHPPFRARGVHRVVVLHDLCGLGTGFPKHKAAYWRHYLRLRAATHLADAIVPISHATRDAMAARFPASRNRLGPVVYNGLDRPPVPPEYIETVLGKHGLARGSYVVAFATWQERKNFAATLSALQRLRQKHDRGTGLTTPPRLVGIAPGREVESIRRHCVNEGLDDALILSGVPDDELDAFYAGALALLWPSTCEGFGYPVVEAMAQGCPTLVGPDGPGAELVDGAIEPLASLNPATIAQRCEALQAATGQEREHLRRLLRARAADFSAEHYRERLRQALHPRITRPSSSRK